MTTDRHEQELFDLEPDAKAQGPVECLGMTFPNDEERRKHFSGHPAREAEGPGVPQDRGFPHRLG